MCTYIGNVQNVRQSDLTKALFYYFFVQIYILNALMLFFAVELFSVYKAYTQHSQTSY